MTTEDPGDLSSSSGAGLALENYPGSRQRQYLELPHQPAFLGMGRAAPRGYDPREEMPGAMPGKGLSCRPLAANTAGSRKNEYFGPEKAASTSPPPTLTQTYKVENVIMPILLMEQLILESFNTSHKMCS